MGKLVNKRYLILLLLFSFCATSVFAQSKDVKNNSNKTQVIEESEILLNDNSLISDQSNQNIKTPSTVGLLIRMILVLVIVIGLIYGVLWFIKKKTNVVKNEDDFLRRVSYINIAPGKTVEVITLIDKAYLIGVTEDNITLLGEIDDKELINAMNINADKNQNIKKPLNFSEVLELFTKSKKNVNAFTESEQNLDQMYTESEENSENV